VVPTPVNFRGGEGGVKGYQAFKRLSTGPMCSSTVIELNEENKRVVRLGAASSAMSELNEENKGVVRSSAYHMWSSTFACKGQSLSCKKAESQYGKILYVPQPHMRACKVTLGVPMCCNQIVCKRKETQPLTALDSKQKISFSLI
jgi:hypothetical protein